ncbi:MAG TPA: sugar phosphate isomerase/epimerase family protein [Bryobacteraceae bacterium]|nr:sugar phosphate isomerase/epimerase family protein [Bryobacteraceae bacterium]
MFARIKSARFDAVELRLDVDLTAADRTGAIARDHGLEIASLWASQPLSHHPLNSPDSATRAKGVDDIRRATEVAAAIGCTALLLVPGRVGSGPSLFAGYEETWKRFTGELSKCIPAAASHRVVLTVENVWSDKPPPQGGGSGNGL